MKEGSFGMCILITCNLDIGILTTVFRDKPLLCIRLSKIEGIELHPAIYNVTKWFVKAKQFQRGSLIYRTI